MVYESEIQFTLDTICPWTYLALRRLRRALTLLPDGTSDKTTFTLTFQPYQLYPKLPAEGQSKEEWYAASRYGDTAEKFSTYQKIMSAHGEAEGIKFAYGGEIANTFPAHRMIQYFQEKKGPEVAGKLVDGLYRRYFEEEKNPSAESTLREAGLEAGLSAEEVDGFLGDEEKGLEETKEKIMEQRGNQVDAVPIVTMLGKRRDHSLEGAKEVEEYVRTLEKVVKESQ